MLTLNAPEGEAAQMTHLTVRNIPPELSEALEREKARRGTSLNQTVIDLLCRELGCTSLRVRSNGLRLFAGTWTEKELRQFDDAIAATGQVDEELWK
jgi:hypothetical protein